MQGKGKDIIQFVGFTNAFVEKLCNWKRKVEKVTLTYFTAFARLCELDDEVKDEVATHLITLHQLCPTRGPWAACGPVKGFVRSRLCFCCCKRILYTSGS